MDPKELEQFWQQSCKRTQVGAADFWQAAAAFWQTVADIQARRAATLSQFYQNLPTQLHSLAKSTSPAEFVEQLTRWQQQNWLQAWHLGADTHQERLNLFNEWQKLGHRNGIPNMPEAPERPTPPSSYYAAHPEVTPPAAKPAAKPAPAKAEPKPEPKPEPKAEAKPAPKPEPVKETKAETKPEPKAEPKVEPEPAPAFLQQPLPVPVAEVPATPIIVNAEQHHDEPEAHQNGHHAPEAARNAAQAVTLAGATSARRSVVASHRSRSGRRPH